MGQALRIARQGDWERRRHQTADDEVREFENVVEMVDRRGGGVE